MLKQKRIKNFKKWENERIKKGCSFKFEMGVLFGISCKTKVKCIETNETYTLEYTNTKSKMKFAPELVHSVHLNLINKEFFLADKHIRKANLCCSNCNREFKHLPNDISLLFIKGSVNKRVCFDCGMKYIAIGAVDIVKKRNDIEMKKENLIISINKLGFISSRFKYMEIEKLEEIYIKKKKEKEETDRIEAIIVEVDEMEDYLKTEYNVHENLKNLKCEEQIVDYFCNLFTNEYCSKETFVICKIGYKFYEVVITANIESPKQDRGNRLYWVESIEKVTYKEISKPLPKEKWKFSYSFELTKEDKLSLDNFLKEKGLIAK